MTERLSDDELRWTRDALADAPSWHEVAGRLDAIAGQSPAMHALAAAFVYLLREDEHGRDRSRPSGPYDVMISSADGTFPPLLSQVEEPVLEV